MTETRKHGKRIGITLGVLTLLVMLIGLAWEIYRVPAYWDDLV